MKDSAKPKQCRQYAGQQQRQYARMPCRLLRAWRGHNGWAAQRRCHVASQTLPPISAPAGRSLEGRPWQLTRRLAGLPPSRAAPSCRAAVGRSSEARPSACCCSAGERSQPVARPRCRRNAQLPRRAPRRAATAARSPTLQSCAPCCKHPPPERELLHIHVRGVVGGQHVGQRRQRGCSKRGGEQGGRESGGHACTRAVACTLTQLGAGAALQAG